MTTIQPLCDQALKLVAAVKQALADDHLVAAVVGHLQQAVVHAERLAADPAPGGEKRAVDLDQLAQAATVALDAVKAGPPALVAAAELLVGDGVDQARVADPFEFVDVGVAVARNDGVRLPFLEVEHRQPDAGTAEARRDREPPSGG